MMNIPELYDEVYCEAYDEAEAMHALLNGQAKANIEELCALFKNGGSDEKLGRSFRTIAQRVARDIAERTADVLVLKACGEDENTVKIFEW